MNRTTLLHLTMTVDTSNEASYYGVGAARDRMQYKLATKLGEALREAKGPITLTLELYKEDG